MTVSIIILNYKSASQTVQCVQSILAHPPTVLYEIIIVDHSPRESGEMLTELTQGCLNAKLIVTERNQGYAAGNNRGIRMATGEYLVILNPDTLVTGASLMTLYQYLLGHPQCGIVGPRLENNNHSLQYSCLRFPDWKMPLMRRTFLQHSARGRRYADWYELRSWSHEKTSDVDWIFGAAMMIRRSAIQDAGLLDEHFFLYLEDVDWCRRFWEKGWRVVYEPSAVMIHEHRRESARRRNALAILDYPTRIHIRSFLYYMKKYRGKPLPHTMNSDTRA